MIIINEATFPVPRSSKALEKRWIELETLAKENSKNSQKQGITWSSKIDWNGFPQRVSYAKTKDNEVIRAFEAEKEDLVKLEYKHKNFYLSRAYFKTYKAAIEQYLRAINTDPFSSKYWRF